MGHIDLFQKLSRGIMIFLSGNLCNRRKCLSQCTCKDLEKWGLLSEVRY